MRFGLERDVPAARPSSNKTPWQRAELAAGRDGQAGQQTCFIRKLAAFAKEKTVYETKKCIDCCKGY